MQFQIPQFIEHETLFLGPLTIRQSAYIGGSIAIAFFIHMFPLPGTVAWMFSALSVVIGIALSFTKIEGRPLPAVIASFFTFSSSSKLYLWEMKFTAPKILKKEKSEEKEKVEQRQYTLLKDSKNRLNDLLFKLNIEEDSKD